MELAPAEGREAASSVTNVVRLQWPRNRAVPRELERSVQEDPQLLKHGEYGPLSEDRLQALQARLDAHHRQLGISAQSAAETSSAAAAGEIATPDDGREALMTLKQVELLRVHMLKAAFIKGGHGRLMRNAAKLLQLYSRGRDPVGVLQLARDFRAPPVAVLRAILSAQGHSKKAVQRMLSEAMDGSAPDERLSSEVQAAQAADVVMPFDDGKPQARAQRFEEWAQEVLRSSGAAIETEQQQVRRLADAGAKPTATPDLLVAPGCALEVDGTRVHWIECKRFYGTASVARFSKDSRKQAQRYGEKFGPGAFLFRYGFSQELQEIMAEYGCTLLNAAVHPEIGSDDP